MGESQEEAASRSSASFPLASWKPQGSGPGAGLGGGRGHPWAPIGCPKAPWE